VVVVPSAIYSLYLAGRYREALETAERAIDLCEGEPTLGAGVTIGNPYAWCLHYRGFLLNVFGRLEEGARELSRALEVAREQGDLETAGWAHLQHVNLAAYRGDPDGGLSHALQELEIAERIGDSFSRGWAYTYVGYAHLLREEWGEAAPALERGLEIVRESRTGLEAEALRMALIARALGVSDYERARELGREAVELARRQGARASEINALRLLASLLLVCGGPDGADEAETALEAGLKLARESGARGDEAQLLVLAVELPRVRGDGAGVERALREARELCAEIGATGHLERLEQELAALSA
jgi:tetratricopeptide (TPR) repeat protein